MAKSNPLAAAKAHINALESKLAARDAAAAEARRRAELVIETVKQEGQRALAVSRVTIDDLVSVNAELRDACEEVQKQRNKAQYDAKTYRGAFWVLFIVAALSAVVDAFMWWRLL